jgi:iron complex outermembrane receptor protein
VKSFGYRHRLFVGTAVIGGLWACGASAQERTGRSLDRQATSAIEEVVVTARRREENLQTTPVAITAITADTLEKRNVQTLEQISQIAPNFRVYEITGGLGGGGAFMRGIGYGDNAPGQDSPVGFYIDGVIAGRTGSVVMDLLEPERVEVLRGPQGTLFGRNSTAGAVLVTSHHPSDEFSGMVKGAYGNFNASRFQGRIDSGLLGHSGIKFSAAFAHNQREGVHDNGLAPSNRDPGARSGDAYWLKVVGDWDRFTATLTADYNSQQGMALTPQIVDANAATRAFIAASPSFGGYPYTVTTTPMLDIPFDAVNEQQSFWSEGINLTLNYRLNDYLSIKSISAVRAYKRYDPNGYGPARLRGPVVAGEPAGVGTFNGLFELLNRGQSQRQKSQELQLLGSVGDFNYVAGLYYFKEGTWDTSITRFAIPQAPNGGSIFVSRGTRLYSADSKSTAAFAQVDWRPSVLNKKLEVTGGVRWTKDKREFVELVAPRRTAELNTKNTSFLVSASYQWTPNAMTFVRYSTAYRAGGFNVRAPVGVDPTYRPEKLKSLEGGFKLDLLDNRVRLNGSAFYNRYDDLQVTTFVAPSTTTTGGGNLATNANARYKGFELELQTVPVDGLTLTGSVGYVKPEYKNYPQPLNTGGGLNAGCTPIRGSTGATIAQDCADIGRFNSTPHTTANASVTYELSANSYGQWSVFLNYYYQGKVAYATFPAPISPFQRVVDGKSYGLLSGRITLSDIPLSGGARGQIALFGDNLTNKKYNVQGIDFTTFASITWGTPRTFGIEGKVEF